MQFGIRTIDELGELRGQTVLLRVDINQPIDRQAGTLKDDSRVRASIPTIAELADRGAKVVLLAHQGSDIEYQNFWTTEPHAAVLNQLLGGRVKFIDDVCGPAARAAVAALAEGEILLLDNVRFMAEEQTLFETNLKLTPERQAQTEVVKKLAPLADAYVCDAFAAAHRDQPSLCGFEETLPSAMGRLFEKEYTVVSELMSNPARPCLFVLGGAKISDAFLMMETVLANGSADEIAVGGLAAVVLLWAEGQEVGEASRRFVTSLGYHQLLPTAEKLVQRHGPRLLRPVDLAYVLDGARLERPVGQPLQNAEAVDVGQASAEAIAARIMKAKTVFVNGPMGVYEKAPSALGTRTVMEALAATEARTVLGGGDSIAAAKKFGVLDRLGYVCTGGGALIRFLSGEQLPVVVALRRGSEKPLKARA
jgi:phosphoglycerate kinase